MILSTKYNRKSRKIQEKGEEGSGKTGGFPARHLFFQDVKKIGGRFWFSSSIDKNLQMSIL